MLTDCISPRTLTRTKSTTNKTPKASNIFRLASDEKWLETAAKAPVIANITTKINISLIFHSATIGFKVFSWFILTHTWRTRPKMSILRMKPKQADTIRMAVEFEIKVAMRTTRLEMINITSNLKEKQRALATWRALHKVGSCTANK